MLRLHKLGWESSCCGHFQMGQPQLLWTSCARASPLPQWRVAYQYPVKSCPLAVRSWWPWKGSWACGSCATHQVHPELLLALGFSNLGWAWAVQGRDCSTGVSVSWLTGDPFALAGGEGMLCCPESPGSHRVRHRDRPHLCSPSLVRCSHLHGSVSLFFQSLPEAGVKPEGSVAHFGEHAPCWGVMGKGLGRFSGMG